MSSKDGGALEKSIHLGKWLCIEKLFHVAAHFTARPVGCLKTKLFNHVSMHGGESKNCF